MGRTFICSFDEPPIPDTSDNARHEPWPRGYIAASNYADEMVATHEQSRCPSCGELKIWTPKKTLAGQLFGLLDLDAYLDDQAIPNPDRKESTMSIASTAARNADEIVKAARTAIGEHPRNVAVADVATSTARRVTAQAANGDVATELVHAHHLIAELAVRLAERDGR